MGAHHPDRLAAANQLQVSGHRAPNLHAHVAASVPNLRHLEHFHDHQRIERMRFAGTLDPDAAPCARIPADPDTG